MEITPKQLLIAIGHIGQRLRSDLIADVPAEIAICEFDCRKSHCRSDEWLSCERRLCHLTGALPSSPSVSAQPKA